MRHWYFTLRESDTVVKEDDLHLLLQQFLFPV